MSNKMIKTTDSAGRHEPARADEAGVGHRGDAALMSAVKAAFPAGAFAQAAGPEVKGTSSATSR